MQYQHFTVEPVAGALGAELSGIDLADEHRVTLLGDALYFED